MGDLPDVNSDWTAYTNRAQPKTTASTEEANRFVEYLKLLNFAADPDFQASIMNHIEGEGFLRFLALECLLSNLDSPLLTGHNYYLYLHPGSGKFIWIPWDLNEAFGGFTPAGNPSDQMNLSLDRPFTRADRLSERLLAIPGIRDRYHKIVRELLASCFNAPHVFPVIDAMSATIRTAVANDPMVSLAEFEAALLAANQGEALAPDNARQSNGRGDGRPRPGGIGRPRMPLKTFIDRRGASAELQLDGKTKGYEPQETQPFQQGGPRPGGPPPGPRREPPAPDRNPGSRL